MRDLRTAAPETLLAVAEIVAPVGPAPFRRSKFLELVAEGKAPAPALRAPRCTRWRWADIQRWLNDLAAGGGA
jgi:predicted DNA-binding transcriptional regulator AlpA